MGLLASIAVAFLIGYMANFFFWPVGVGIRDYILLKCSLAGGLGLGICSCIFFVLLILDASFVNYLFFIEIGLVFLLSAFIIVNSQSWRPSTTLAQPVEPVPTLTRILSFGFYIALILAIAILVMLSLKSPHGEWDAWGIWNLRARFIFRGDTNWKEPFLTGWSDYPLLLPGIIARGWKYTGSETTSVPITISLLFTISTPILMFASLAVQQGKNQAFLAGMTLLGTPFFVKHGASQYADIALGFFFLVTIVLFSLHDKLSTGDYGFICLAGVTAGLSGWTKNEGLLFLIAIIFGRLSIPLLSGKKRRVIKELVFFMTGLIPIIALIIYFKAQIVPENDLIAGQSWHAAIEKLSDFSRYSSVFKAFLNRIPEFGSWSLAVNPPIIFAFYALLVGIRLHEEDFQSIFPIIITLASMLIGYFFVYITTPNELSWHLSSSLDRLLLQIWPSIVYTYYLSIRTAEKAIHDEVTNIELDGQQRMHGGRPI